ncbi:hypothetical protein BaRGS_00022261 [Batillaria attramentaria]|uniref:Uncharacterized protein n=1 Tax=Batillaria attramentaria TaxID=370345 RepID=A0ABD0KHI3_9CAEN
MASGGVADNLTCSLCLEGFKNPKFLRCHHSFCEECLIALTRNSARRSHVTCPECRKVTQLPPGGVSQLQTNFYITRLLDANADRDAEICQVHRNEKLRYYCVNCDVPICLDCRNTDHDKHDTEGLASDLATAKGELEKGKLRLESASRDLENYLAWLEQAEKEVENKLQSAERKLSERTATVSRWVAEAVDNGLKSLKEASEKTLKPLRNRRSEAKRSLDTVQKMEADLERVLTDSSSSSQDVISWRRNVVGQGSEERLRELTSDRSNVYDVPILLFTEESLNPEAIAEFIGTVDATSKYSTFG